MGRALDQLGAHIGDKIPMEFVVTGLNGWPAGRRTTTRSYVESHFRRDGENINIRIIPHIAAEDRPCFKGCARKESIFEYEIPFSEVQHSTLLFTAAETARCLLAGAGPMAAVSKVEKCRSLKPGIAKALGTKVRMMSEHLTRFSIIGLDSPTAESVPMPAGYVRPAPPFHPPAASAVDPSVRSSVHAYPGNVPSRAAALPKELTDAGRLALCAQVKEIMEKEINDSAPHWNSPRRLITSGFLKETPLQGKGESSTIHLQYRRETLEDPVELRIVTTDEHGISQESAVRTFAKPKTAEGEKLLSRRILFDGLAVAKGTLMGRIPNDQPLHMVTGRSDGYILRTRIGNAVTPRMESDHLGEAIGGFCMVRVNSGDSYAWGIGTDAPANRKRRLSHTEGTADLPPEARHRDPESFKQDLRRCLSEYVRKSLEWYDAELVITGFGDMNDELPSDLGTYVHLKCEKTPAGDVDLKIETKNKVYKALEKTLRRTFSCGENGFAATFYKELLFASLSFATSRGDNWPTSEATMQFRGRLSKKLKPPMTGKQLGDAMLDYKPVAKPAVQAQSALRRAIEHLGQIRRPEQLRRFLGPRRAPVSHDSVLARLASTPR